MSARILALGCLLVLTCGVAAQPPRTPRVVGRLGQERGNLEAVAFSPDGKLLAAVGQEEKRVRLWTVADAKELPALAAAEVIWSIGFSPDGSLLATGGKEGTVRIWHVASGQERGRLNGNGSHTQVAFSADGKTLCAVGAGSGPAESSFLVRRYEVAGGKELSKVELTPRFDLPVLSADGRLVAWNGQSSPARHRDLLAGREKTLGEASAGARRLTFLPDGRVLVAVGPALSIQVWERATGRLRLEFVPPTLPGRLVVSPDGQTLASYGGDQSHRLWDLETGDVIASFAGPGLAIAFSPDGTLLASGGESCTAELRQLERKESYPARLLSARMLEKHWSELGAEARQAHQTMGVMTYFAPDTLPFLQGKLMAYRKPTAKAEEALLAKLLADLDSDRFDRRQQATDKLEELGEPARPVLEKAMADQPSLEVRQRVVGILKVLDQRQTQPPPETMRMLRGVELLERVGSETARKILQELADGPAEAPVSRQAQEALERVKRRLNED